jgi:hypothetical protein
MKFAYDVPGYLCGHRYSQQDSSYYDATNNRFLDLALYGNHTRFAAGVAPAFSVHGPNAREGLLLDNSSQWEIDNPIPWEGTVVVVMKIHMPSPGSVYTYLFGDAVTPTSNGMLIFQPLGGGGTVNNSFGAASGILSAPSLAKPQDQIFVSAFAMDQEMRKAYSSSDGVTVNSSATAVAAVNGNAVSLGWNGNVGLAGSLGARMVRVGNNSGAPGNVVANATNYAWLFEDHFFKGNVLRTALPQLKEFMDTLKAYYAAA